MRSTELHGERRGWNLHLVRWVVRFRRIFLEVWIFRNVRDELQNFVADHFTAAAAIRKNSVAHQKHAGARLVLMAYLVNSRLLDQLSWSQRAIALIIGFDVGVLQFHSVACIRPSVQLPQARGAGSNSRIRKWDAFRVATSWSAPGCEKNFCCFLFRQPRFSLPKYFQSLSC